MKNRIKNIIFKIITFILFITLLFSLYKIIRYKLDENNVKKQIENIEDKVIVDEIPIDNDEIINTNEQIPESNPYWDYINMNMINVDFNELKSINNDVRGWIQVSGTNINYPFVQGNNNDHYLNHSFDKSTNIGGWVFADYRNNLSNFNDKNTIIYAHGMDNNTMFGSLKNILKSDWINDTNNYVVKLSTEYENTLWQIFSVYRIKTTNDYMQIDFNTDNEFENFYKKLINRSNYNFNTSLNINDRILTLSTCYNNSDKIVLHAKLIKRITKN